jgi:hypothetical protein
MKTLSAVILVLVVALIGSPPAHAAPPKITLVGSSAFKDGSYADVAVWTTFKRGNSVRIVHCLAGVTKKNTCRDKRKKAFAPKLVCKQPGNCAWYKRFRTKMKSPVSGYVVVSNSDGSVRKRWITSVRR